MPLTPEERSRAEGMWKLAVEHGMVPVSGPIDHDDMFRLTAFVNEMTRVTEGVSDQGDPNKDYLSANDLKAYASIRGAECVSGSEVRDRLLRQMEGAMSTRTRQWVERRIRDDHEAGKVERPGGQEAKVTTS